MLLAGGVETTTSASGGSGREASPACALLAASAGLVGLLASAWVSDSEGLGGFSGRPAGSAAASETCWRAEATASKESSSLGVAPTSSCMGSGWAVSQASIEAEDTEPASISTGSQWAASTGANDWCWACSACLALVVFLAVLLAQGEASGKTSCCSDEELVEELTACAGGTALGGGSVLEAAVDGGSHTPGGPLGLGLGGGRLAGSGRNRLTLRSCRCFGARNGRIVGGLHAVSELRPKRGVRPHVVPQPCISGHPGLVRATPRQVLLVRGLLTRLVLALPLSLASFRLAFPFALERGLAFVGSFALPSSLRLPVVLRHGCTDLGCRLPEQVEVERG